MILALTFMKDFDRILDSDAEFDELVKSGDSFVAAFLLTEGCQPCVQLMQIFMEVAKDLKQSVPLHVVDCEDKRTQKTCSSQLLKGYPTVKMFNSNQNKTIEMDVARNQSAIFAWVNKNHKRPFIHSPTTSDFIEQINKKDEFIAVLTTKSKPANLLYRLGRESKWIQIIVNTDFEYNELQQHKIGKYAIDGQLNVIYCKFEQCQRYQGNGKGYNIQSWIDGLKEE
ncbi:Protein_disulfide isomerase [Hexamita inflata]|uniref:Protein disulfide isomerase n=1 Tax=Hexamita inflata TaxID=28002 RepID=A0AA86Q2F4_9EUKA|nr:Protein disulfide isomerase [Hexamita inflata]